AGTEPVEALAIETAQSGVIEGLVASEEIQLCAFEDARPLIAENIAPEAHATGAVLEDPVHIFDAVLCAVRAETAARELHRARGVRDHPQIAAEVFVECGDLEVTQPVSFGVGTKETAL